MPQVQSLADFLATFEPAVTLPTVTDLPFQMTVEPHVLQAIEDAMISSMAKNQEKAAVVSVVEFGEDQVRVELQLWMEGASHSISIPNRATSGYYRGTFHTHPPETDSNSGYVGMDYPPSRDDVNTLVNIRNNLVGLVAARRADSVHTELYIMVKTQQSVPAGEDTYGDDRITSRIQEQVERENPSREQLPKIARKHYHKVFDEAMAQANVAYYWASIYQQSTGSGLAGTFTRQRPAY
jgi:hypothetical protein